MGFLIIALARLALGWGWPSWASKMFSYAVPIIGAIGMVLGAWALFASHYEHKGAANLKAKIRPATAKATEAQIVVNHAPAAKSQTIARQSDDQAKDDYAASRAAGLAYANGHRVRDAVCPVGRPDLPGENHPVASDDRSGEAADMVALSQADFDLLRANSTRLAKVQADAEALIAAGVAVPSDAPDTPKP